MMVFLLFLLALVSANKDQYIYNGKPAKIEDFPYQACIAIRGSLCGGCLISNTYILTAAHCLENSRPTDIIVSLGSADITKIKERNVLSIVYHPEFDPERLVNDIGLIEINHVNFTNEIRSIPLPSEKDIDKNFESEDCYIAGWGLTDAGGWISPVLLSTEVKVMNQDNCAGIFKPGLVKETNICAVGDSGASTCRGDSGGPLVHKSSGILLGLTSFGPKGNCRKGSAFTRVTKYREWIREHSGV